jgi:RNA polymerase sigma factor (sigma-70 family)
MDNPGSDSEDSDMAAARLTKLQGAQAPAAAQTPAPAPVTEASVASRLRFEAYLERFRKPIYNYVLRLIPDTHLAEDITQETFIRLFRDIDAIRDETASAWMYRVARNLVTDHRRKKSPVLFTVLRGRGRDNDDDDSGESLQFEGRGMSPVEESYDSELQGILRDVLARMTPKFRDPLLLCDVERLTYEQAADVLGCSVKTVSARLHRAREFVGGCLRKYMDENDIALPSAALSPTDPDGDAPPDSSA